MHINVRLITKEVNTISNQRNIKLFAFYMVNQCLFYYQNVNGTQSAVRWRICGDLVQWYRYASVNLDEMQIQTFEHRWPSHMTCHTDGHDFITMVFRVRTQSVGTSSDVAGVELFTPFPVQISMWRGHAWFMSNLNNRCICDLRTFQLIWFRRVWVMYVITTCLALYISLKCHCVIHSVF